MDVAYVCFKLSRKFSSDLTHLIQNNITPHFTVVGSIKEGGGFNDLTRTQLDDKNHPVQNSFKLSLVFLIAVSRLPRNDRSSMISRDSSSWMIISGVGNMLPNCANANDPCF